MQREKGKEVYYLRKSLIYLFIPRGFIPSLSKYWRFLLCLFMNSRNRICRRVTILTIKRYCALKRLKVCKNIAITNNELYELRKLEKSAEFEILTFCFETLQHHVEKVEIFELQMQKR